jgi:hypothetical protein
LRVFRETLLYNHILSVFFVKGSEKKKASALSLNVKFPKKPTKRRDWTLGKNINLKNFNAFQLGFNEINLIAFAILTYITRGAISLLPDKSRYFLSHWRKEAFE